MKRTTLPVLCAVVAVYAVGLTSTVPARADQRSVNLCGKEIAKDSAKILALFEKAFLGCYSKRHACALDPATRDACLTATLTKSCSCDRLDITDPARATGQKLAALEAKIAAKCDPAQVPTLSLHPELLDEDPKLCVGGTNAGAPCALATACPGGDCTNDPRRNLAFAARRNCKCGTMVGDQNGTIDSYAEVQECIELLLLKQATSQVGWDTDPRAQGEIFDILVACNIVLDAPCP